MIFLLVGSARVTQRIDQRRWELKLRCSIGTRCRPRNGADSVRAGILHRLPNTWSRTMEAERLNAIAEKLDDLATRGRELRRYL
jgi:hypothetical protein